MKCKLLQDMKGSDGPKPAGTEIDHAQAHMLVKMGVAEPADEECRDVCETWWKRQGLSLEDGMRRARHSQRKVSAGIHPEDDERFERGEIAGYNPDGSYVPGPNAKPENHSDVIFDDED